MHRFWGGTIYIYIHIHIYVYNLDPGILCDSVAKFPENETFGLQQIHRMSFAKCRDVDLVHHQLKISQKGASKRASQPASSLTVSQFLTCSKWLCLKMGLPKKMDGLSVYHPFSQIARIGSILNINIYEPCSRKSLGPKHRPSTVPKVTSRWIVAGLQGLNLHHWRIHRSSALTETHWGRDPLMFFMKYRHNLSNAPSMRDPTSAEQNILQNMLGKNAT